MKQTRILNCFKMPNSIITDDRLTYTAKRVAATLYASRNALGFCRLGLRKLARYSGCSISTVRDALSRLETAGYISIYRNHAWSDKHGRVIRHKDTIICRQSTKADFTFIARAALRTQMRKSSFSVYLLICRLSGNGSRAYPSLRRIAELLGMGLSTVCRAVQELSATHLLHAEHCIKRNGAHTSNSYFLVHITAQSVSGARTQPQSSTYAVMPIPSVAARRAHLRTMSHALPVWSEQVALQLPAMSGAPPGVITLPASIVASASPRGNPQSVRGVLSFSAH